MEAIWVAAEMRAGAAFAHSILAVAEMEAFAAERTKGHQGATPPQRERHAV